MSKERVTIPQVEIQVKGQPLATIKDINWQALLLLIGEGRTARVKKITLQGENIHTLDDLNALHTKCFYHEQSGLYRPGRREIALNMDQLLIDFLYDLSRDNTFSSNLKQGLAFIPQDKWEKVSLKVLETLGHEVEHALQEAPISRELFLSIFGVCSSVITVVGLKESSLADLELLKYAQKLAQLGMLGSFLTSRFVSNIFVPYKLRKREIKATAQEEKLRHHFKRGQAPLPFTLEIDWKRLKTICSSQK